ncbi:MAG: bifunctional (p)ppGpp synthetase/guanosine-3',5'-bis(diphosphate) 3'-pyrophosphohydrolase [Solirubrobacterales bacterium]|nr:bifunctional (p)ppGpp synthetase/guanosine-3',5'-bis(diphosphate) 3'-pyrophosphohydrolase [Solirubrobacterales bacterium]MBV9535960.1 bifunctional (p)ppGpp synthetase/guanosine-3',5'-bis(diphosphate) 3'-pyrophosphohydrolase [Solirubrobacterales bacterium]
MTDATPSEVDLDDARAFVQDAYRRRSSDGEQAAQHPQAVARLLSEDGQPPRLVLAGLLHDLLEDTEVGPEELRARFGPEVTGLVQALTQDPAISDYYERKAALRRQVLDAGRDAATVALADKSAKLAAESSRPKERRLGHYQATLEGIEKRYGRSRLSERLHQELQRFPAEKDASRN